MAGADWSLPTLVTDYVSVLADLKQRDVDSVTLLYDTATNLPTHAIRWNRSTLIFEEWSGAAWVALTLAIAGGGTGATTDAGARTALGIGSMGTQNSNAVTITGGTISGAALSAGDITSGTLALNRGGTGASLSLGASGTYLKSNGSAVVFDTVAVAQDMTGGRLTLESGVPVSTTDQSAKTTLYYTPMNHNLISLYDGSSSWITYVFSELSISLSGLTASKPYDVFCYSNSGTPTLELLVWTDATTRATALVRQDGRLVKTGATTRRYLGTIYINSTGGQTDDTYAKRYVWNAYNMVDRPMVVFDSTETWTYNSSYRQANGSTANQLDFVVGLPEVKVSGSVNGMASVAGGGAVGYSIAIGLDSTTTVATNCMAAHGNAAYPYAITSLISTYPGIGRHRLVWLEQGDGATTTWYGNPNTYPYSSNMQKSGINGEIAG